MPRRHVVGTFCDYKRVEFLWQSILRAWRSSPNAQFPVIANAEVDTRTAALNAKPLCFQPIFELGVAQIAWALLHLQIDAPLIFSFRLANFI